MLGSPVILGLPGLQQQTQHPRFGLRSTNGAAPVLANTSGSPFSEEGGLVAKHESGAAIHSHLEAIRFGQAVLIHHQPLTET